MTVKVSITIIDGSLKGREFEFENRTTCIIGRAVDCYPRLPNNPDHQTISRYHCLLDINPPAIRIRDFGSKNGTYINNNKIGQRRPNQSAQEGAKIIFREHDLHNGDEIKLGHTVFRVNIHFDNEIERETYSNYIEHQSLADNESLNLADNLLEQANYGDINLNFLQDYKLIRLIGKGDFSEIYLIENQLNKEKNTLKLMFPQVPPNPNSINKFKQELENIKSLNYPYIVNLQESIYRENVFYLLLEYCNGGNLVEFMKSKGRILSIHEALLIICQVLDGLEYAHKAPIPYVQKSDKNNKGQGLVHKDLKPEHIFIHQNNEKITAKIDDYGLTKAFDLVGFSGQTLTGNHAGLPIFMPRQQVLDLHYAQPDLDVWAAAACLYYMLTGFPPRHFDKGGDPFLVVLQNDAIPLQERNPYIPENLADVIDTALIDNPEIVFKSALEFKQALLSSV
jgi:eukaryotic-like serine/threonine-protein kinase